ncbi:hypothetical protein ACMU_10390 [Actibacterium mucosum KCTC 23349]|uniref:Arginine transporter n=1 Tax=Actibacterium mucosum KCTC 23349 TaxID=1454373 RepID=A0A037ZMT8_9RHOB|nr:hypothetical protein [Actibacterium mucosum]KAJ56151.1 hypothetical protein ACMU_10390 [Actibacterium mucosum KCTC 23349]
MRPIFSVAILSMCLAVPLHAGKIERACNQSDRKAATRSLCGCIQDAADLVLSTKDQSLAAKFFSDPHKAQEIRQSDNRSHESFWKRYREFGDTAEAFCG